MSLTCVSSSPECSSFALVKEAGAGEVVRSVMSRFGEQIDSISLRRKPFETLFKYMGTGLLWASGHRMLAVLFGAAESLLGIGLGTVGSMIDKMLGFGGSKMPQVSDSSLYESAKGTVDSIISRIRGKSAVFERRLMSKNGMFEMDDLLVAWAAGVAPVVAPAAAKSSLWSRMGRWIGLVKGGERLSLIGLLYGLLKAFSAGVLVHTGISFLTKDVPDLIRGVPTEHGKETGAGDQRPSARTLRRYVNSGSGVEKTIIAVLDSRFHSGGVKFSRLFERARGKKLAGSEEMQGILQDVVYEHDGMPIEKIDRYEMFVAPDPAEMASRLLPEYVPAVSAGAQPAASRKSPAAKPLSRRKRKRFKMTRQQIENRLESLLSEEMAA